MRLKENNFAYIDGANLYNGSNSLGWKLDYRRFRVWLKDKYSVERAYLFIGLAGKNSSLYKFLQESGYTLVFKETVSGSDGKIKGNCDADLVLNAVCDAYENNCDRQIIISSDGDYASLVKFLADKKKLIALISPSISKKCSILLKRIEVSIVYINDQRNILELKRKNPQ
jgi:uncharacterized LabA/DUF88 family protein